MKFLLFVTLILSILSNETFAKQKYNLPIADGFQFQVIAWSKNGLLAYATSSSSYDKDSNHYSFEIQVKVVDCRSDKEVYSKSYGVSGESDHDNLYNRDLVKEFASEFKIISKKLQVLELIPVNRSYKELKLPIYNINREKIELKYIAKSIGKKRLNYQLTMIKGNKSKVITNMTYHKSLNEIKILNIYKSPFEDRVAVVLQILNRRSSRRKISYKVIGGHLSKGFK